jgi:uncharacterized DUF497 family protein
MTNIEVEWDLPKAAKNLRRHQVSFDEAATLFEDPVFITAIDEEHSLDDERYITSVCQNAADCWSSRISIVRAAYALSAPVARRGKRRIFMRKPINPDDYELRDEYDFSKTIILPKGRYAPHRRAGKNVVVLAPDVEQAFPTDESVNAALRLVMQIAKIPSAE